MNNTLSICTLFEGAYHRGVGTLVNSLFCNGFRGMVWAGYKGALPPWASPVNEVDGYSQFQVAEGCVIRFVALETTAHLTNYKPDFMLQLLKKETQDCDGLFYIDPDIVVCEPWHFFEEWISCGVAVCEDVNSPFPTQHPRRVGWRRFFSQYGILLHPREGCYANGGFVGIRREEMAFLELWKRMQDHLWKELGGAEFVGISGGKSVAGKCGFSSCFDKTDQDVLNAAIEAAESIPVSFETRHAMGFAPGKPKLPHALGAGKPWDKRYIADALRGLPPRAVDKEFWRHAEGPIHLYSKDELRRARRALKIASALGRIFRRN